MITLLRCFQGRKTRGSRARVKMHTSRTCSLHSSVIFLTWPISITRYVYLSAGDASPSILSSFLARVYYARSASPMTEIVRAASSLEKYTSGWSLLRKKQDIARKKRENFFLYLSYLLSFN